MSHQPEAEPRSRPASRRRRSTSQCASSTLLAAEVQGKASAFGRVAAEVQEKASAFGRVAAEMQGKAVSLPHDGTPAVTESGFQPLEGGVAPPASARHLLGVYSSTGNAGGSSTWIPGWSWANPRRSTAFWGAPGSADLSFCGTKEMTRRHRGQELLHLFGPAVPTCPPAQSTGPRTSWRAAPGPGAFPILSKH